MVSHIPHSNKMILRSYTLNTFISDLDCVSFSKARIHHVEYHPGPKINVSRCRERSETWKLAGVEWQHFHLDLDLGWPAAFSGPHSLCLPISKTIPIS